MGYAEELAKLQAEYAKRNAELDANNKQLAEQLEANKKALEKSQAENEAAMLQAQQRQQQDFADIALQYKRDYDAALAEDAALRKQEERGSALMGITEAVASLTNLIGVGYNGASNQQYHSYSKDWMDRADAERKQRRNRIDNIRDRQKAMQQQLSQLRSQNAMQYISMRGQDANQRYNAALHTATALASERNKLAQQKANDAAALANIAIQQSNADRQFEEAKRARQAQEGETRRYHDENLKAQMARYGYSLDKDGKWVFTGKPGSSGSGNSSAIKLTLKSFGNEPEETIEIKPGSLISVNANIEHITDINEKDKKNIKMILASTGSEDDKAKKLTKYAVESPELRRILRQSSVGSTQYAQQEEEDFPSAGGNVDEEGFPTVG